MNFSAGAFTDNAGNLCPGETEGFTVAEIVLQPAAVAENQPVHTTVGTLSTAGPDAEKTFTYSLVSGLGSTDNTSFFIPPGSHKLQTAAIFNYEGKKTYSIRVRSTDQGGLSVEQPLTVKVLNLNETPVRIMPPSPSVAGELAGRHDGVYVDHGGRGRR